MRFKNTTQKSGKLFAYRTPILLASSLIKIASVIRGIANCDGRDAIYITLEMHRCNTEMDQLLMALRGAFVL